MTNEEFCGQGLLIEQQIKWTRKRVEDYEFQLNNLHSASFDREFVTGTRNLDSIQAKLIPLIMELKEEAENDQYLLMRFHEQFQETIRKLPDRRDRLLLELAYIHGKNWTEIGNEIHCDRRSARDWCKKAVEKIELPKDPVSLP